MKVFHVEFNGEYNDEVLWQMIICISLQSDGCVIIVLWLHSTGPNWYLMTSHIDVFCDWANIFSLGPSKCSTLLVSYIFEDISP